MARHKLGGRAVLGAVGCVVAATLVAAVLVTTAPAQSTDAAIPARTPPVLSEAFGVFRQTQPLTPVGGAPSSAAGLAVYFANAGLTRTYGLNTALARQAPSSLDPTWVIPGSRGLCIYVQAGAAGVGTCTSTAQALAGGLYFTGPVAAGRIPPAPARMAVFGLVPDSNKTVAARSVDGVTSVVPVIGSTYEEPFDASGLSTLSVRTAGGTPVTLKVGE